MKNLLNGPGESEEFQQYVGTLRGDFKRKTEFHEAAGHLVIARRGGFAAGKSTPFDALPSSFGNPRVLAAMKYSGPDSQSVNPALREYLQQRSGKETT